MRKARHGEITKRKKTRQANLLRWKGTTARALFSSLLTWATLSLAWICTVTSRSYLYYGELAYNSQMFLLPLVLLPFVLALPAIVILILERSSGPRGTTLNTVVGACASALQACLILWVTRDDPNFAGYSRMLVIVANLIPGAFWGFFYSLIARRRQLSS